MLPWAEAIARADPDRCARLVLDGSWIKGVEQRLEKDADNEIRLALVDLWGTACKQYLKMKRTRTKTNEMTSIDAREIEFPLLGIAMVGRWIGWQGEITSKDAIQLHKHYETVGSFEYIEQQWQDKQKIKDDYANLGMFLKRFVLEQNLTGTSARKNPVNMPKM